MPTRSGLDVNAVQAAAQALAAGELVAFPTETVYGLGARADDEAAVARIFAAKGRPSDHPLIVHVADLEAARRFSHRLGESARRVAEAFWPGPVTIIAPRTSGVADGAAGGQTTIGLRCPAHPVARALLRACGELGVQGIAAPSANRFGRISPTTAAHVAAEFGERLSILDGGACDVGIESAIVDCSRGRPVVLRPGTVSRERLERALGETLAELDAAAPRASGTLPAHYAPLAALRLVGPSELAGLAGEAEGLAVYSRTRPAGPADLVWARLPDDPITAARELFATLRSLDRPQVRAIWVERPPGTTEWEGVRDRLQRAAAATDAAQQEMES